MSLSLLHRGHCLRTSIWFGGGPTIGRKIGGALLLLLLLASLTYAAGPLASPTPPPPPKVPPIISDSYAGDLNGNRINDNLEPAPGQVAITSDEKVEVELIFNAPVTQPQIDQFLRLGGQITYIYQAISYGWNGLISRQNIASLPAALGATLVQVEPAQKLQYYMDTATQTGRVRPIWKAGFAGLTNGVRGDPNTTIGFLGGGVDAIHADLRGRCVYWKDFSDDNEPAPADYDGHDTLVAGVAVGTGTASGVNDGELRFTYTYADAYYPTWYHMAGPICLPARQVTLKSSAWWSGQTCILDQVAWPRGTDGSTGLHEVGTYLRSKSPAVLTNTYTASPTDIVFTFLEDYDTMKPVENVTIVTSVNPYPGVGDGFNRFSGVAPGCQWAAIKVIDREGNSSSSLMTRGLDELVAISPRKHVQVINISLGYVDPFLGTPGQSSSLRDKVNSVVNNGIVVVVAAGNGASDDFEIYRTMADPARAALAITVGATNDENGLTDYSNYGFSAPRTNQGEDFKPDIVAPGGSYWYTGMMSVDSSTSDGLGTDKEPNDYASGVGTSFSAPFASGCAALVIDALQKQGLKWNYASSDQPLYVKMLLCATASETNVQRENKQFNPSLDRAAAGPQGFPAGKDQYEGYGILNPDAAVEAISQTYTLTSVATASLGGNATSKRVWARMVPLKGGCDITVSLTNPTTGDFDLYLYSPTPGKTGTPVILASSTSTKVGDPETLAYSPTADGLALLVVKRVSGSGTFTLKSTQAGPPIASDVQATCPQNGSVTVTLQATDDGKPNPPGALTYTILSKPGQGRLELTDGTAITTVPMKLPASANKVVYKPATDWLGDDTFTYCADDGGAAPAGGQSNTATVKVTVLKQITVEFQVSDAADDAWGWKNGEGDQTVFDRYLYVGMRISAMRFRNITLPQGVTIKSASLKICSVAANAGVADVDGVLKGQAADNPAPFDNPDQILPQLPATKASTAWKWTQANSWAKSTWYESPDIGPIIQEILNRPKWASGNALVIVYTVNTESSGDRAFWAYDANPTVAPKLSISYVPK